MVKAGDVVCLTDKTLGCGRVTYYDEHARIGVLEDSNGQTISFMEEDLAHPSLKPPITEILQPAKELPKASDLENRFERECMSKAVRTKAKGGYDIVGYGRFAMKMPKEGFIKDCMDKKRSN